VLNRGRSSLARCAYLENYLGFPAGIDIPTVQSLARAHAEEAGCEYVEDMVVAVRRSSEDAEGFVVETQDGQALSTPRVVAATKYDADYLDPLDDEGAMFTTVVEGGEEYRIFDREYPDDDGRTPIPGLYVAGPLAGCVDQALSSAGHGATVAFSVVADWLRDERGYPADLAERYWDWTQKAAEVDDDWDAHAEAYLDEYVPDSVDDERATRVREEMKELWRSRYVTAEEAERRRRRGQRALLEHLDDEIIRAYLDEREE
jgi:hypothetical protein